MKTKRIPNVERIHLEQQAGLSYFQLKEVLDAFDDLSLDAALIRASNSRHGFYVRVTQQATRDWRGGIIYDVDTWSVDTPLDVLGPFYYGNTGPDEVHSARVRLSALRATPGSDLLVSTLDYYLSATDSQLHARIFGEPPEPEAAPRKVGHLTVVK